ncbi:MAG: hypothetical protein JSS09_01620, partial [Verrucomicrobia bacterium]|nr:hypothetical protein [Verrucomicrobiota bacterium]
VKRVSSSSVDRLGTLGAWDSGEGALPSSPLGKRVSSSSADRLGTPPRSSLGLRNLSGSLFPYSASIISKNWGQKDSESSNGLRLKDEFSIGEIIANLPGEVSLNSFYVNSFYKKISKFSLENNKLPVLTSSKEVVLLPFRKIGEGVHTVVAQLENHGTKLRDLGLLKENILDSDVVVKIPKTGTELSIRESFENSLNQYRNLTERYSYLPPEERPIARIYNADTAKIQGFYVQERVDPIEGAPWGKDESINSFTCQNRRILDVVTDLFRRSFVEDTGGTKPGIDLSFSNLGIRTGNGAPVLLDYMENDDAFSYNARICLRDVSNGNKKVKDYIIEGFDKKVEDPVRLSLLRSYKDE